MGVSFSLQVTGEAHEAQQQREQEKTSWTDTVLAVSHDSASGLFTWMSSLIHSNHFALCSRTKRSSNPIPAMVWCLVLVNRSNGPLNVTGLNTINVCACVCCTTAIVCVSTKGQNEFRGIIILIDWGSREKCQKWSEMISSCTDLNYISTRATEENNLRVWHLSW